MSKAKISGIKEIRAKLQRLKNISNDDIVMAVAERGAELAQEKFGSSVIVKPEMVGSGRAIISAKGNQAAFIEYGTGIQGEGSYNGELPTQPITFTARNGDEYTTEGWVYNYFVKEIDKNAKDHTGFEAVAPMWRTANELVEREAESAIREFLNEKGV